MEIFVMDDKTSVLLARIADRRAKLDFAAQHLKGHFVGLDDVIDKIISSIEAWYCMPELSTRPTIVCLWGLTGNGKTDLVRRLVKLLEMADRFVEVQMTNKGTSQYTATTMQGLLCSSNLTPEEPGILLLDEIQRFRSVDQDGKEIADYQFQDLWMLLSDGSFGSSANRKQTIIELLCDALYHDDNMKAWEAEEEDDEDEETEEERAARLKKKKKSEDRRRFKQGYWAAKQLKKALSLPDKVEEIMEWDHRKKLELLTNMLDDKDTYDAEVYSKLLIFVSGNLDEAYSMADMTDETDIDADIFYKNSLNINLLKIKTALRERFKPEQIARFGNTQIIYPALNRKSFETIIQRRVEDVLVGVKETSGVDIQVDKSVYDSLYRNGVFPVQGTRPVFSTVSSMFESALPKFTMQCLKTGQKTLSLKYDDKCLIALICGNEVRVKNEGEIDRIKANKRNINKLTRVALHEAGHAVAYSLLFGVFPTQVVVGAASDDRNGFVGLHEIDSNKENFLKQISVFLAGRVAEEIVFGDSHVGAGAVMDIHRATQIAAQMIRMYAMYDNQSKIGCHTESSPSSVNLDINPTNDQIESVICSQKSFIKNLLETNLFLLGDVADFLIEHEKIEFEDYERIFKARNKIVRLFDSKETIYTEYRDMYQNFWRKVKPATSHQ